LRTLGNIKIREGPDPIHHLASINDDKYERILEKVQNEPIAMDKNWIGRIVEELE